MARILLVEQRKTLRERIEQELSVLGTVTSFTTSSAARERLKTKSYDLIMTTHHPPEVDCRDFIEQLTDRQVRIGVLYSEGVTNICYERVYEEPLPETYIHDLRELLQTLPRL